MTDLFDRPALVAGPARQSRAAQRERRAAAKRRRRRRRTTAVVVVAFLVLGGVGTWGVMKAETLFGIDNPGFAAKDYPGPGRTEVEVTVEEGASGQTMGQELVKANVVASVRAFVDAFKANPSASRIQPGTYQMLTEMKAADAVARLAANTGRVEYKVTIVEGQTVAQILEKTSSIVGTPVAEFEQALATPASIGLPAEAGGQAEGWLYATTYVFEPDETATSMLSAMIGQTINVLDAAGVPPAKRQEVLKIASLIEREAGRPADRPKMARVIANRMERDWPLGIDASTLYGRKVTGTTGKLTIAENHDLANPYSLYERKGLPPTPIASPSKASIDAVMRPAEGEWMFWTTVNLETKETRFAVDDAERRQNEALLKDWRAAHGG